MLLMLLPVTESPVTESNVTEPSVTGNASVTRKLVPIFDCYWLPMKRLLVVFPDFVSHKARHSERWWFSLVDVFIDPKKSR